MHIGLIDIAIKGDNKDYNSGFGTHYDLGNGFLAGMLTRIMKGNQIPLHAYAVLSALLKKNGHSVSLIRSGSFRDCDLFILHASLVRFREEIEMLQRIKSQKNVTVCIIGPLTFGLYSRYEPYADVVLIGDWETVFIKFENIDDLPRGVVKLENLTDMDQLPFPDWSIYDYRNTKQYPFLKKRPIVTVTASKRCPYKCNYCPYILTGSQVVQRSVKSVVSEIKYLQQNFKVRSVVFRDPIFTFSREWTLEFCDTLVSGKVKLDWVIETRADHLDEELLITMKKAGLTAIKIGVESSDLELLKKHRRRSLNNIKLAGIVKLAEEAGLKIISLYILGLPGETEVTIKKTIWFSRLLNTHAALFSICTPLPGTKLYDEVEDQTEEKDLNKYTNYNVILKYPDLDANRLKELQRKAEVGYYFRLGYFLKHYKALIF